MSKEGPFNLLFALALIYVAVLVTLNFCLGSRGSLRWFSWNSINGFRYETRTFRIGFRKLQFLWSPLGLWTGDPVLVVVLKDAVVSQNGSSKSKPSSPEPKKSHSSSYLKYLARFPVVLEVQNLAYHGVVNVELESIKVELKANQLHLFSHQIKLNGQQVVSKVHAGIKLDTYSLTLSVKDSTLDIEQLQSAMPKRHSVEKTTSQPQTSSGPVSLPFKRVSIECENTTVLLQKKHVGIERAIFAVGKLDEEEGASMNFGDQQIYEILLGVSNVKVTNLESKKLMVYLPFLNIFSLCNLEDLLQVQKKKNDLEFIESFAATDRFLLKTTVSVSNLVINADIDELLAQKKPSKSVSKPHESEGLPGYLSSLLPKFKIRFQLLGSVVNLALAPNLSLKTRIEDIVFDTSLANTFDSLFNKVSGSVHRMVGFLIRNIQFSFVEPEKITNCFYLDYINTTVSFGVRDARIFGETDIDIGMIEIMLVEFAAIEKLYAKKPQIEELLARRAASSSESQPAAEPATKPRSLIDVCSINLGGIRFVSCFQTPIKYYDGVDQSELNKYRRGVYFELSKVTTNLDFVEGKVDLRVPLVEACLIRDYDKEQYTGKHERFLRMENFHLKYFTDKHQLSCVLPLFDGVVSAEVLWSILFIKAILMSVVPKTPSKPKKPSSKPPLKYLFGLHLLMLKVELPNDIDLVFELNHFETLSTIEDDCHLRFKALRMYGISPYAPETWSLILILVDTNTTLRIKSQAEHLAIVNARSIRFEIPFEYVFFETFDNFRALTKAFTKIEVNFQHLMNTPETQTDFSVPVIMPSLVDTPLRFPKIRVNTRQFQFCMHDDPFEALLNESFLLGHMEQKLRLTKMSAFEKYEQDVREKLEGEFPALTFVDGEAVQPQNYRSKSTPRFNHTKTSSRLANEVLGDDVEQYTQYLAKVKELIELPRLRLLSNISKSWIVRVKAHQRVNGAAHYQRLREVRGGEDPAISKTFTDKYPVIGTNSVAALFSFELANLRWDFDEPHFGLENYKQFMHTVGKGMPYDMRYGIFFPVNLDIFCSRLTVQIKDYPIPFLSFGGGQDDGSNTVHLSGDFVVAEQIYVEEELRYNFVPLVSQYKDPDCTDNMFAVHVSRTMTNVKFYTDMKVDVQSSKNAIVSWYPGLQPALGYAMDSFDVLSKPPLDPSPKVGFWDKFALLFHGKFHFRFTNGIHLFMKSKTSPYDLMGKGGGFIFRWNDKVDLTINETGKSQELLIVNSKSFDIVIPRFGSKSLTFLREDSNPYDLDYSIEKIVWKLNSEQVIWKLGFLFERNERSNIKFLPGQVRRSTHFKPHYEVRLRNPATFKNEEERNAWDCYDGFRSQYLHMCVSLDSSSPGNTKNTVHLTPLVFAHFFAWWNTFQSSLGLPIKAGTMFKNKFLDYRPSEGFGSHLFSISYTLNLKPVHLTHVYIHPTDIRANSNLAFTGLKCSIDSFAMDLHQVKGPTSKKENPDYSLEFKQGEVDFVKTDLRLLVAEFNQQTAMGMLAHEIGITESSSLMAASNSSMSERGESEDQGWLDMDDFVEVDTPRITAKNPKWRAIPLAFSPRFCYFLDEKESDLPYPFSDIQERTHRCFLGNNHPERTPFAATNQRVDELKDQIKTSQTSLESLDSGSNQSEYVKKRAEELKQELKLLNTRLHVTRCLRDSFEDGEIPDYDEFRDETETSDVETTYSVSRATSRISRRSSTPTVKSAIPTPEQVSSFRNRFIIYHVVFRWSAHTKRRFSSYIDNVADRRSLLFNLSRNAVRLAEELAESQPGDRKFSSCDDQDPFDVNDTRVAFSDFTTKLRENEDLENVQLDDTYLLKFILPQLCFETDSKSAVLVTSKELMVSSISVDYLESEDEEPVNMESRSGIILQDAFFYVFDREKALNGHYKLFTANMSWPPRLPVEMYYCPHLLMDSIVIWNASLAVILNRPNKLQAVKFGKCNATKFKEKIRVMIPDVVLTANSEQYNVIYSLVMGFMDTSMTEKQKVKDKVKSLVRFTDGEDFSTIRARMITLQMRAWMLLDCKKVMLMMESANCAESHTLRVDVELEKIYMELSILVSYLQHTKALKHNDSYDKRQWVLAAEHIRLELLDGDNKKFVVVEADTTFYTTEQRPDGASRSQVRIQDFIAEDMQPHSMYKTIVEKYGKHRYTDTPMVFVDWKMLEAVGGIPVVEHKSVTFAPLKIELDVKTARQIYQFVYPKPVSDDSSESSDDDESIMDSPLSDGPSSPTSMDSASSIISEPSENNGGSKLKRVSRLLTKKRSDKTLSRTSSLDLSSLQFSSVKNHENTDEKQYISQMIERSKKYQLLNRITIDPLHLVLSIKGEGSTKLVDVHLLELSMPKVEYLNKVWSQEDFFQHFKKEVIRLVLKNSGKIVANKITKRVRTGKLHNLLTHNTDTDTGHHVSQSNGSQSNTVQQAHSHLHHQSEHFGKFADPDVLEPHMHTRALIDQHPDSEVQNFEPLEEISEESSSR
ncbi:hypothetical protein OGAPHI_002488 [Ogataea philodendri]|uniref:Uncharacterized protein n=1 Tax=Ogataea philodendri TaxID=1378263 RepID=A0A9P8T735_9ASCO|nr:uncharacterized protein OGAPHI_002488 [Ogataea philodendri]KAH3668733.1 hypothetical protein OGAPHI_002488 [Ogataea philodendri]